MNIGIFLVDITLTSALRLTFWTGGLLWSGTKRLIWGRQKTEAEIITEKLNLIESELIELKKEKKKNKNNGVVVRNSI